MESEFSSGFGALYADVRVLSNDAVGFTAIACERVADNAEGLLVVPPPAPPAPPPSKDSLRIAACQQMLPSVPLAQRRSWSAWPAAPHGDPEVVVHEDLRALLVGGRSAVVRVEVVLVDDFQSGDLVYCCVTRLFREVLRLRRELVGRGLLDHLP
jgi:hypothetical protein